jgi:hypothetical protein
MVVVALVESSAANAETFQQAVGSSTGEQISGANLSLTVTATLSSSDATLRVCVDSFFDWDTFDANGSKRHYDARVVRNCDVGALTRSKWIDDFAGLVVTGTHKAGSCLVVGTDSQGRFGTRVNCVLAVGAGVAPCGSGSAACYIRKRGVIIKTGWNFPQSPSL